MYCLMPGIARTDASDLGGHGCGAYAGASAAGGKAAEGCGNGRAGPPAGAKVFAADRRHRAGGRAGNAAKGRLFGAYPRLCARIGPGRGVGHAAGPARFHRKSG